MIEFKNVSFAYPDSSDGGLRSIDLTIPNGQFVVLCGRSGCGKTTLILIFDQPIDKSSAEIIPLCVNLL